MRRSDDGATVLGASGAELPSSSHPDIWDRQFTPRQEDILDGLQDLVLRNGFDSFRIASAAKDLGTSFATLYGLASSRDALVALVVERWYQRSTADQLLRLSKARTPVTRLRSWTDLAVMGSAKASPTFWRDAHSDPEVRRIVEAYMHHWALVLHEIVDEGIARGAFRAVDTQLLADIWESLWLRLGDAEFLNGRPIAEVSRNWVDLILHGVLKD